MKAFTRTLLAAALTLICSSMALATPSGQIWIPSTDAKGFTEVNISIDNYIRFSGNENAGPNYYNAGVTVGVLPFEKFKLEVGVDFLTDGNGSIGAHHPIYFNFKGAIPEDAFSKGCRPWQPVCTAWAPMITGKRRQHHFQHRLRSGGQNPASGGTFHRWWLSCCGEELRQKYQCRSSGLLGSYHE